MAEVASSPAYSAHSTHSTHSAHGSPKPEVVPGSAGQSAHRERPVSEDLETVTRFNVPWTQKRFNKDEDVLPEIQPDRIALTQQPLNSGTRSSEHPPSNPYRQPPTGEMFRFLDNYKEKQMDLRRSRRQGSVSTKMTASTEAKQKKSVIVRRAERRLDEAEEGDSTGAKSRRGVDAHGGHVELSDDEEDDVIDGDEELAFAEDQLTRALHGTLPLSLKEGKAIDKERIVDFVQKKRDIFHLEYAIKIKHDEINKLKEVSRTEYAKLQEQGGQLARDTTLLENFLKENERAAVEAIKYADQVARGKQGLVALIKKTSANIASVSSELGKSTEQARIYLEHAKFLEKVAPKEWRAKKIAARRLKAEEEMKAWVVTQLAAAEVPVDETEQHSPVTPKKIPATNQGHGDLRKVAMTNMATGAVKSAKGHLAPRNLAGSPATSSRVHVHGNAARGNTPRSPAPSLRYSKTSEEQKKDREDFSEHVEMYMKENPVPREKFETLSMDFDPSEDLELYFQDPHELLAVYAELEERNLSLIQNGQETEELLEALKTKIVKFEAKMESQMEAMRSRVSQLKQRMRAEEEAIKDMRFKMKMFSHRDSEGREIDISDDLMQLEAKVKLVFTKSVGSKDSNISTVQMLTAIEARLHELFDTMDRMPRSQLQEAERIKEKERRQRAKDELKEQERKMQEARVKRALDRAKAAPKKQTGRRPVYRSHPPVKEDEKDKNESMMTAEEEEYRLYFT